MRRSASLLATACLLQGCAGATAPNAPMRLDRLSPPARTMVADAVSPLEVGDRLLGAGEAELALKSYARSAGPDGAPLETRIAAASADIVMGRLNRAERTLRAAVAEAPRNAMALNNLGVVLTAQGRSGEAYRTFRTAFALLPSPGIRANLLAARDRLPDYEDVAPPAGTIRLGRRENGVYDLNGVDQGR